ncbi:MAG: hypothetical protein M5U07_10725 [Xanthobacteraceae bacterium]|nr:hypothetical protein [Xanthobacteraceae bacterium]
MRLAVGICLLAAACGLAGPVFAQDGAPPAPSAPLRILPGAPPAAGPEIRIDWQVANRFRLFRHEADFNRLAAAMRGRGVLEAEQLLAVETDGRGWAAPLLGRLCLDAAGEVPATCERDGARESYLAPPDHRVAVTLAGAPQGATCAWSFEDGLAAGRGFAGPCAETVRIPVAFGRPTLATVDVTGSDGETVRAATEIAVRDLLIAGLGDSIAAGEGNPDKPVALDDEGFCFRRFISGAHREYFRPGRAGFKGNKTCESARAAAESGDWARLGARWLSPPCHRSLYGYQMRAALALAIDNPRIAVTFLPLACTGATIADGLFGAQRAREINCGRRDCAARVPAQLAALREMLAGARRGKPDRALDLVLLTIGANDIDFSGLVADAIIDAGTERLLFRRAGVLGSVEDAAAALERQLPRDFARLRTALAPMVGGDLSRVVFVSYGHPALSSDGAQCPGGADGFDVHPAFGLDSARLAKVAGFVSTKFLPRLKALATCANGCADPGREAMTFVDTHQGAFVGRGICARSLGDPDFDRACFLPDGRSFAENSVAGATEPLACGRPASEFRAYAPRTRWIRTANDSYFAAMTFPEGTPSTLQPTDIHDATWGVLSAVYGGAVHPTAEGHAAMADAALREMRRVLSLPAAEIPVTSEPLPAPDRSDGSSGPHPLLEQYLDRTTR